MLTPDEVKAYVTDTLYLITQVVGTDDSRCFQYFKIASEFQAKYTLVQMPRDASFYRAVSEDKRYGPGHIGPLVETLNDLHEKSMKTLSEYEAKGDLREFVAKLRSSSKELAASKTVMDSLPTVTKDQFKTLVLDNRQDPVHFHGDADLVVQNIKRTYESFRYVNAFFLGLFDLLENRLQVDVETHYFNPNLNAYADMYRYTPSRFNNPQFYRYHLPCLSACLAKTNPQRAGIKRVLNWVFKGNGLRFYRVQESHHLNDVVQDRLKQGEYAFYTAKGPKYVKVIDLINAQETIFRLFQLTEWVNLYYFARILTGG